MKTLPKRYERSGDEEHFDSSFSDWPLDEKEIDQAIEECGPSKPAEFEAALAGVLHILRNSSESTASSDIGLFGDISTHRKSVTRVDLAPLVVMAFKAVAGDDSIDLTIADPERNARFIQQCWRMNIRAGAAELNWKLFNSRKSGLAREQIRRSRYVADARVMNLCTYASEWALRFMQDQAYFAGRRDLSLDRILCDPVLARDFEGLARRVAPGFSSLDYRWSALRVRKSIGKNEATSIPHADFTNLGLANRILPERIPQTAGLVWLNRNDRHVYLGAASNLREQISSMLKVEDSQGSIVPRWLLHGQTGETKIAIWSESQFHKRKTASEAVRIQLVNATRPALNVLANSLRPAV